MDDTILFIYCLCDEFLNAYGHTDDPQTEMSTAEVILVALVAATYHGGKVEISRRFLKQYGYVKRMLSKSRLNRRLHGIEEALWQALFEVLASTAVAANTTGAYLIDSFPVPVCDNYRIRRCRLYPLATHAACRGKIASKRRFFYGLRVHMLVSGTGQPVEFVLAPGGESDPVVFRRFRLEVPEGSVVVGDKAYNDYDYEDLLADLGIGYQPLRKKNSHRKRPRWQEYLLEHARHQVETSFSLLTDLFPKHIHAVTARGFELKVVCFVLAFAFLSLGCQSPG